MTNFSSLRDTPGAITAPGESPVLAVALLTNDKQTEVQILTPTGVEIRKVVRIDEDANSDRLVLVTNKIKYNWRPLREADGIWLSRHHVPLPVDALLTTATGGPMITEILSAYSSGDSPYVLGTVYETGDGRWVRSGGTFLPMSPDDTTYADMDRIIIDPEKTKEFLDLYDRNYVTVSDAVAFETVSE